MKRTIIVQIITIVSLFLLSILFFSVISELPDFGNAKNPPNRHVIERYLERGEEESGAKNIITNIILNYRGYDTMGEVTVIFTALCAVLAILKREDIATSYSKLDSTLTHRSIVIKTVISLIFPILILFGFYIITHGEDTPGGGFQGGTIIAASLILYALVFGFKNALLKMPPRLRINFENVAPLTFFTIGILGLLSGLNFLTYMLPVFTEGVRLEVSRILLSIVEIGIGIGGGAIFTSIFFAMQREEK